MITAPPPQAAEMSARQSCNEGVVVARQHREHAWYISLNSSQIGGKDNVAHLQQVEQDVRKSCTRCHGGWLPAA